MHTKELWRWHVTDPVTGRRRPTRHVMSEEDALRMDPTAERVPHSLELRQVSDQPLGHSTPIPPAGSPRR